MSDCGVDEPTDIGTTKPPARSFMLGSWLLTQQSSAVNELLFLDTALEASGCKRLQTRKENCARISLLIYKRSHGKPVRAESLQGYIGVEGAPQTSS
ncbi:hypothetical protein VD0002_g3214 [Verticillium dahliae]|uniref:Uncharacterized protein n=1 Tax=Verticillium dahliae TaxID=27337 RepID=A0A444RNM4_VERDA|nr:hypothetical protein VD0002_g3214 [Verticillium dahliae]RXG42718.1 hypothetical protein VDGE_30816 [Verticillium dahliae]